MVSAPSASKRMAPSIEASHAVEESPTRTAPPDEKSVSTWAKEFVDLRLRKKEINNIDCRCTVFFEKLLQKFLKIFAHKQTFNIQSFVSAKRFKLLNLLNKTSQYEIFIKEQWVVNY